MATITKFEDLEIWRDARKFAQNIFETYSNSILFSKDFKLREQINRAISIMDNISEGFERNGRNEFIQFLSIAKGSAGEVKSQLYRAFDREYITQETLENLCIEADELGRKIGGFIKCLAQSDVKGSKFKNRL